MEKRFEEHLSEAEKGKEGCPKIYNAIRKYGRESFVCNKVLICNIADMDDFETYFIETYETNTNKGYNVITHNIVPKQSDGTRVEKIRKTMFEKWENDTEYIKKTMKNNRDSLRQRAADGELRTKHTDLPHHIYRNKKGRLDIRIIQDNIMKVTSVQDNTKSFDELVQIAVKKRDTLLKQVEDGTVEHFEKGKDHTGNDLPEGIFRIRCRNSQGYGYIAQVIRNKQTIARTFTNKKSSMNKKLNQAIEALNYIKEHFDEELEKKKERKQEYEDKKNEKENE